MTETIVRMKTVEQSAKAIKELDPETAITEWFIRCLCKENKVKHFMTGTKILVNYDDLLRYLNNGFHNTVSNDEVNYEQVKK